MSFTFNNGSYIFATKKFINSCGTPRECSGYDFSKPDDTLSDSIRQHIMVQFLNKDIVEMIIDCLVNESNRYFYVFIGKEKKTIATVIEMLMGKFSIRIDSKYFKSDNNDDRVINLSNKRIAFIDLGDDSVDENKIKKYMVIYPKCKLIFIANQIPDIKNDLFRRKMTVALFFRNKSLDNGKLDMLIHHPSFRVTLFHCFISLLK